MGNCIKADTLSNRYQGYSSYPTGTSDPLLREEEIDNVSVYTALGDIEPFSDNLKQIQSLVSLTLSDNAEMQRMAAFGFLRMSKKSHEPVMSVVLEGMTNLLLSNDDEVLRVASLALSNFGIYGPAVNKNSIIQSGCLRPIVFLLKSENLDIQCNACGCVTTLASSDANRLKIIHQGVQEPLINLAQKPDRKAQISASGALLNLSHSVQCRKVLVEAGIIPVLINLLESTEESVQFYTSATLSNMVVEVKHRRLVMEYQHGVIIERLIFLMNSETEKVQSQSCLAFRNIASEDRYQVQLVKCGGLTPLLALMRSNSVEVAVVAVAALQNLSIHSSNINDIIDAGFLPELSSLLCLYQCPDLQCHVAGTLRNLAAEDRVKNIIESGCLVYLAGILRDSSSMTDNVLAECTDTLSVLSAMGDFQTALINMFDGNFYKIILHLMKNPNLEIQLNCATILGCLINKKEIHERLFVSSQILSENLELFINSKSQDLQQMAMWLVIQLHYSGFDYYKTLLTPQFINSLKALQVRNDYPSKYKATLLSLMSILNIS